MADKMLSNHHFSSKFVEQSVYFYVFSGEPAWVQLYHLCTGLRFRLLYNHLSIQTKQLRSLKMSL